MQLTISQITELSRALTMVPARDPQSVVQKLSWDSRLVQPGMLFVALPGEAVDGNDFIIEAFERGAAVVIASRQVTEEERFVAMQYRAALLYATDGLAALQRLATEYRGMLDVRVIGITGSSGKTSTRHFVSAVTEKAFMTAASIGNYNNEIGLPATVLSAPPTTEVLIVEIAMRGLGQIAELCEIAQPQMGIITNIGSAHLELLGSKENIARAKAELIEALPDKSGIALLNGDDPYTPLIRDFAHTSERAVRVMTFGLGQQNDIRALNIKYDEFGCPSFDLLYSNGDSSRVYLQLPGAHSVYNALAAAAVGSCLRLELQQVVVALEQVQAAPMRQKNYALDDGCILIDDTYNANPDSMSAALEVLAHYDKGSPHIAVLGDMGELGATEAELHREVGSLVCQSGVDVLITIGHLAENYALGALAAGMDESSIIRCSKVEEVLDALAPLRDKKPVILVKASRLMGLERVVELLIEGFEQPDLSEEDDLETDIS